jgi:hypothetical protein
MPRDGVVLVLKEVGAGLEVKTVAGHDRCGTEEG